MSATYYTSPTSPKNKPLYRGTQIVWYVLGIIEFLLAFRFFLKLLGANPDAPFTRFIYLFTGIFAAPFLDVFNITQVQGNVFEWTTLLAMIVYWFLAWAVLRLFLMNRPVSTPEATEKLKEQEDDDD